MSEEIIRALRRHGPLTGSGIAAWLQCSPEKIIVAVRRLVDSGIIGEYNGFYSLDGGSEGVPRRRSFPWVEGAGLPAWVLDLASGQPTVETVTVLAELGQTLCSQGYPPFALAYIDVRLRNVILYATGECIDSHLLRFMPVDISPIRGGPGGC